MIVDWCAGRLVDSQPIGRLVRCFVERPQKVDRLAGREIDWSVGGWLRGQAGCLVLPHRRLVGWLVGT